MQISKGLVIKSSLAHSEDQAYVSRDQPNTPIKVLKAMMENDLKTLVKKLSIHFNRIILNHLG